jgi:hypothetical protein
VSKRHTRRVSLAGAMRALLDGRHFVFLCFLPCRAASLGKVVAAAKGPGPVRLVHFSVPPGALWNGEACEVFAVPKSAVERGPAPRTSGRAYSQLPPRILGGWRACEKCFPASWTAAHPAMRSTTPAGRLPIPARCCPRCR